MHGRCFIGGHAFPGISIPIMKLNTFLVGNCSILCLEVAGTGEFHPELFLVGFLGFQVIPNQTKTFQKLTPPKD